MARSPNYPQLSLGDAIDGVRKVWDAEQWNKVSGEVVAKHLGYSGLNGSAQVTISALRKYGLLEGSGDALKVTKDAVTLMQREQAKPEEYAVAVKRAALSPTLFAELAEEYRPEGLPSEGNLSFELLKRGFNKAAASKAARAFLATMGLVSESSNGYTDGEQGSGGETPDLAVGDLVQWESQGVLQLPSPQRVTGFSDDGSYVFVDGTKTGLPREQVLLHQKANPQDGPPAPPSRGRLVREAPTIRGPRMQQVEGYRQDVFVLDEGEAIIQWPEGLSSASYEDLKDWLDLVLRKVKRSVPNATAAAKTED